MNTPEQKRSEPEAVLNAAHATFDNLRFQKRADAEQSAYWTRRIADVIEARAAYLALAEIATHFATWSDASPMRDKLRAALERCGVKS